VDILIFGKNEQHSEHGADPHKQINCPTKHLHMVLISDF